MARQIVPVTSRKTIIAGILPTHTAALFDAAVRCAAEALRAGEVVALPTETVYGLAANALDPVAVARIFEIKGRPSTTRSSSMCQTWRWPGGSPQTGRWKLRSLRNPSGRDR